jgi:hypothetical protein
MIRKIVTLLFVLSFAINGKAQDFQLGKVSLEELQEKRHPKDSSASAAVLFKKARTFFTYTVKEGFIANHEVQYRIKIYKKEGLKWATFEVPYYVGYKEYMPDIVKFSEAYSYNLEQNKVVKTKLNNEGSFKEQINKNWKKATITFPDVKEGTVIEFKYIHKSENIFKFPDIELQYDIPVNSFVYKTQIPEVYIYKSILKGKQEVKTVYDVSSGANNYEDELGQTATLRYKQINTTFSAQDIPAFYPEKFVDNHDNYKVAIQQELERIRYTDKPDKDYSVTWEGVAKTIYKEKEFGEELKLSDYFIPYLQQCLNGKSSGIEKMDAIFKYVQGRMNWDNKYGVYTDKGVKKAFESQIGNIAEINFILINMLNGAGIQANPVLVSTLDNGVPVFPGRTGFNYVIASAFVDGKTYLLDASNKFTMPNIYPLSLINWSGRKVMSDGTSSEVSMTDVATSRNMYGINAKLDAKGVLEGSLRNQKTDFEALSFREKNAHLNHEAQIERLENQFNGLQLIDYSIENAKTELSKPLVESYSFKIENAFDRIGGKFFISPLFFFTTQKNPFIAEERKMPIYFGFPKQDKYVINLEIPEGYIVESLPSPLRIMAQDGIGSFSCNAQVVNQNIQIVITNEISKVLVDASLYPMLKDYYQKIIEKQNEKIVLKKA